MRTVYCHPEIWEQIKSEFPLESDGYIHRLDKSPQAYLGSFDIRLSELIPKTQIKKTGKYIIKHTRQVVEKEKIKIEYKLWTYGPEDLSWLLYVGEIEEEMVEVPAIFILDDQNFNYGLNKGTYNAMGCRRIFR